MKLVLAVAISVLAGSAARAEDTRSRQEVIASGLGILSALTDECPDFRIDEDRLSDFLQSEQMPDPSQDTALKTHWLNGKLKVEGEIRQFEFEGRKRRQINSWSCSTIIKGMIDPDNIYRVVLVRK